jgi:hypothetical protein
MCCTCLRQSVMQDVLLLRSSSSPENASTPSTTTESAEEPSDAVIADDDDGNSPSSPALDLQSCLQQFAKGLVAAAGDESRIYWASSRKSFAVKRKNGLHRGQK